VAVTAAAFCSVGILAWVAAIGVAVLAVTGEHGMHHAIAQYAGILQRLTIG
jgi:putative flippase GtrA